MSSLAKRVAESIADAKNLKSHSPPTRAFFSTFENNLKACLTLTNKACFNSSTAENRCEVGKRLSRWAHTPETGGSTPSLASRVRNGGIMQKRGLISLAIAAAAGFRGVLFSLGAMMDRYQTKADRSTAQNSDARYPKHPPGTVAQAKRASIKAKNRAHHRAACRG